MPAGKLRVGKQSKRDQQKFLLTFLMKLCLLFCFICLWKISNRKATVSKQTMFECLSDYDFELYQTMFQNKTVLFVVYK